ncbi:MAG: carbohydrate ABC transporter permease [Chloroflexi bacterium]|nr:MAG: carbohydrate ABC transporter permease [Chloroflexota bacterium]
MDAPDFGEERIGGDGVPAGTPSDPVAVLELRRRLARRAIRALFPQQRDHGARDDRAQPGDRGPCRVRARAHARSNNTYLALIVPFGASVFNVFLLRQAFLQLPQELYDAAVLEGCGHLRYLWRFAVPLSRPTLAIIALLTGIRAWNDFQWPLIITDTADLRPIQVGLTIFRSDVSTNFQLLMAGSVMALAPIVVLFLLTQRQLVQGIARSGLRG